MSRPGSSWSIRILVMGLGSIQIQILMTESEQPKADILSLLALIIGQEHKGKVIYLQRTSFFGLQMGRLGYV